MGRGKEPEQQLSNPLEAKKYRDEASGHTKNGNYERALASLDKSLGRKLSRISLQRPSHTGECQDDKRVRKHI
ncbi:unnamed protein product [Leptosia nina]|uniref:Uncharacterized protein n=1 Tax=Leptosia nina TaxID=320188 RepID=A0AAV1J700_9NEOP